jgi:hypothetical protein
MDAIEVAPNLEWAPIGDESRRANGVPIVAIPHFNECSRAGFVIQDKDFVIEHESLQAKQE